ncbi:MAG: hypothetical protein V7704_02270 [Aurantimonas endophytica]|uniref:hypothetical protein n=1 Tax=Aurantimonas endophytica TaxID=1522175 RepID=UPI0030013855
MPDVVEHQGLPIDRAFLRQDTADYSLADAVEKVRCAGSDSLFQGWADKVRGTLNLAYPIYLKLLNEGPEAWNELLKHPYLDTEKGQRKRKPSAKNPALTALQVVARPQDMAQQKACSQYAAMLLYAASSSIPSARFAEVMRETTLREATQDVRKRRRKWRSLSASVELSSLQPCSSQTEPAVSERVESSPFEETSRVAGGGELRLTLVGSGFSDVERSLPVDQERARALRRILTDPGSNTATELLVELAAALKAPEHGPP